MEVRGRENRPLVRSSVMLSKKSQVGYQGLFPLGCAEVVSFQPRLQFSEPLMQYALPQLAEKRFIASGHEGVFKWRYEVVAVTRVPVLQNELDKFSETPALDPLVTDRLKQRVHVSGYALPRLLTRDYIAV